MASQIDRVALVAGLLVVALGVVLLLDAGGTVDLGLAVIGPIAAFVCGAVLLTLGLSRSD